MTTITQEQAIALCAGLGITFRVKVDTDWFYTAIRHVVRNCEFDVADYQWVPGKYDGGPLAECIQCIVDLAYPVEVSP